MTKKLPEFDIPGGEFIDDYHVYIAPTEDDKAVSIRQIREEPDAVYHIHVFSRQRPWGDCRILPLREAYARSRNTGQVEYFRTTERLIALSHFHFLVTHGGNPHDETQNLRADGAASQALG